MDKTLKEINPKLDAVLDEIVAVAQKNGCVAVVYLADLQEQQYAAAVAEELLDRDAVMEVCDAVVTIAAGAGVDMSGEEAKGVTFH